MKEVVFVKIKRPLTPCHDSLPELRIIILSLLQKLNKTRINDPGSVCLSVLEGAFRQLWVIMTPLWSFPGGPLCHVSPHWHLLNWSRSNLVECAYQALTLRSWEIGPRSSSTASVPWWLLLSRTTRGERIVFWWPDTNMNIIRFPKNCRIRIWILFGFPKMTEYEYE